MPDLRLSSTWDLSGWRFDGEAGVLTLARGWQPVLRSKPFRRLQRRGRSDHECSCHNCAPTIRGRIGSSPARRSPAPNLLATSDDPASGGISIAPGIISMIIGPTAVKPQPIAVRTGTGSIDLAAAGDITLGNRASVIYTRRARYRRGHPAWRCSPQPREPALSTAGWRHFHRPPAARCAASRRIWLGTSPPTATSSSRPGCIARDLRDDEDPTASQRATGWTVAFDRFEQGIGALGGGNIAVDGGRRTQQSLAIDSIDRHAGWRYHSRGQRGTCGRRRRSHRSCG